MNQTEINAAIDAQKAHEQRSQSCSGVLGKPHDYRRFGRPGTATPAGVTPAAAWSECFTCGATETHADYLAKNGATP